MPSTTTLAIGALLLGASSLGYSVYSGEQQRSAQNRAQDEAKASALKQEKLADEQVNAANKKAPNSQSILSAIQQYAKGGTSSTMLTGKPQGIDPSDLPLGGGKTSLLGG